MMALFHDVAFVHDDVLFLVLDNNFFIDNLHCVELPIPLETAKKHLGKTT